MYVDTLSPELLSDATSYIFSYVMLKKTQQFHDVGLTYVGAMAAYLTLFVGAFVNHKICKLSLFGLHA